MNNKILLTVPEAAERLGLGRTFVYDLVMRGKLESLKLGKARRIRSVALEEFVASEREQQSM